MVEWGPRRAGRVARGRVAHGCSLPNEVVEEGEGALSEQSEARGLGEHVEEDGL